MARCEGETGGVMGFVSRRSLVDRKTRSPIEKQVTAPQTQVVRELHPESSVLHVGPRRYVDRSTGQSLEYVSK